MVRIAEKYDDLTKRRLYTNGCKTGMTSQYLRFFKILFHQLPNNKNQFLFHAIIYRFYQRAVVLSFDLNKLLSHVVKPLNVFQSHYDLIDRRKMSDTEKDPEIEGKN